MPPSRLRLEAFAQALATGKTPVEAAKAAGYPNGSSFANNARKRASRKDVKAMVVELQKPAKEKLQTQIGAYLEFVTEKLMGIVNTKLDPWNVKASDRIRAIDVLAKLYGWYAPKKPNVGGEQKRPVVLSASYTVEPSPQEGDPT